MKRLRQYIRNILKEDLAGFINDVKPIQKKFDIDAGFDDWISDVPTRKQLKRIYRKHRDKTFLDSLNTVHWAEEIGDLANLTTGRKDELSCKMYLPDDRFKQYGQHEWGLWVSGWITYATNDQDCLYSGYYEDYNPPLDKSGELDMSLSSVVREKWPEKRMQKYQHQKASSGINKTPRSFPGTKRGCIMLDADTWVDPGWYDNEALVDNWKPLAIVAVSAMSIWSRRVPDGKRVIDLARQWNIPIVNLQKMVIWKPKQ